MTNKKIRHIFTGIYAVSYKKYLTKRKLSSHIIYGGNEVVLQEVRTRP